MSLAGSNPALSAICVERKATVSSDAVALSLWRCGVRRRFAIDEEPHGAIAVSSVAEEYRRLAQERCACGGRYRLRRQMLLEGRSGRHYDRLEVACERCGAERAFLFEISAFYGRRA